MRYFKKENLRNPVFDSNNKQIAFQPVVGDTGVTVLDEANPADKPVLDALESLAAKRMGGVVKISAEIFDGLKKNAPLTKSPPQSHLNQIRSSPSPESFGLKAVQPVAVKAPPQGIRIMEEDQTPPSSLSSFKARFKQAEKL